MQGYKLGQGMLKIDTEELRSTENTGNLIDFFLGLSQMIRVGNTGHLKQKNGIRLSKEVTPIIRVVKSCAIFRWIFGGCSAQAVAGFYPS